MTARLDDYGEPECQMRQCEAEADTEREHPEHGTVNVCDNCAALFDAVKGGDE